MESIMENTFKTSCTEEAREKIFKTLRDWSEGEYQEEMAFLGIDDSNMSWERKKILVILYMLSGVKDKAGWFYIDNANLSEICEVGERTITRVKRDFERLGIIKIKRGYQGSPTRYKFFENRLNKLPKISKKTPESTLAALAGKNVIPATENEIYKSVITSLLSGYVEVPAKVDSKKNEKKINLEGGVQYKDKEQDKDKEQYKDKNQDIEEYKDIEEDGYKEGLMMGKIDNSKMEELSKILSDNNTRLIESINTMVQAIINTKDETIEELKKISTSIDKLQSSSIENTSKSNGIVQSEVNTKVIEELQGKIDKLQEDYTKVIEERNYFKKRFNDSEEFFKKVKSYIPSEFLGNSKNGKDSSSKSNGEIQDPSQVQSSSIDSSSDSNLQRMLAHQMAEATAHPTSSKGDYGKKTVQEASKQEVTETPKADTKTSTKTTVLEGNSNEKSYVLQKLDNLKNSWVEKINSFTTEEQLTRYNREALEQIHNFFKTHKGFQVEIFKAFNEYQQLFDTKSNQFQSYKETTPKAENGEEKNETTAEPSTANSKKVEVSKTDTPNNKETQEKLEKATETPKDDIKKLQEEAKVEEPKQEETVTPSDSEESRDEDCWNPTLTDEQAQEALAKLPKTKNRYGKDEAQEEVTEGSEDEVSDDDMKGVVVGGSYPEENDPEF